MTVKVSSVIREIMRNPIIFLLLFLVGCLANDTLETASIARNNVYKLRRLNYGMSEEEVFLRMSAPAKEEQVVIDEDQYDIWFYITRRTALDQESLVHRNLTPVIFKNGSLLGMGYTLYDRIIYQASTPKKEEQRPDFDSKKVSSDNDKESEEEKPYLDEDDRRMLQEEEEEDFNNR